MKSLSLYSVIVGVACAACVSNAAPVAVVDEDFDSMTLGTITGINQEIAGADLRLHNHLIGTVVVPHGNFNTASGYAFQLTTGTNPSGGWGLLTADNSPRPVALIEGDDLVLSFDMYVQTVPSSSSSLNLELQLTGGDNASRTFTELSGASAGDVVHVSWIVPVTAGRASASDINPRISWEGHQNNYSTQGPNSNGTEVNIAQIDNLVLEVPYDLGAPVGTTYYLDADGGNNGNTGTSPGAAWATLAHASSVTFQAGDQLLLQRGDVFSGKLVLDNENGTSIHPIVVGAYGTGDRPVIDAAGYLAAVQITSADYITLQDIEITGDGVAHVDGSNGKDRYGVYLTNTSGADADGITISNVYFHTLYPPLDTASEGHNPTTYMGTAIRASGQSGNHSEGLTVVGCHFEDLGMSVANMSRMNGVQILDNLMENIGGPAMVPNRCDNLLVRGNTVDGSGQYTDPRMHGRGSGIWPINCDGVLIEKNAFMHARGRYDSCGVHLDIGNADAIVQYNLSMDNEGGFVEILGVNSNCTYRYNISINDGARTSGVNENGLSVGDGHTMIFSGHNFSGQDRTGPFNNYIYNNTIYVKEGQHCSFAIEDTAWGAMIANNLFYVDGDAENGTSPWWGDSYAPGVEDSIVWTNNIYQRGGIFPADWIFYEGAPRYGNPNLANPGGLTAEDYIPSPGAFVEGRGIAVPMIPGDAIGLLAGLAVSEDFFGNPIQGAPDIGAVEVGGGTSSIQGSAFMGHHALQQNDAVSMAAVTGPAGSTYYFAELTGNMGGDDSGWQSSTNYTDSGLLPNTPYEYAVLVRDAADLEGATSVVVRVMPPSITPFPEHVLLDDDFSTTPDPDNVASPFPVHTWYLDAASSWTQEGQAQSVVSGSEEMMLGFGYDEILLQYYTDRTWDAARDYEFTGDWKITSVFENHLGIIVGFGEYDPTTGALLQRIKEITVGELGTPSVGQTGSFTLALSAAEVQAAGVGAGSLIGVFFHRDDDGVLQSEGDPKNDIYVVDNLFMRLFGDDLDLDGDGIPDAEETLVGLDPNDPSDGGGDLDLDGISNAAEYLLGTSISTPNAPFEVGIAMNGTSPEVIVGASEVLTNRLYILEHKSSLGSSAPWTAIDAAGGTTNAGMGDLAMPGPTAEDESFFRVRVEWE